MLRAILGANPSPRTTLGIGDDAAILKPGQSSLVWTIDAQVEGIHFRRDLMSMADLGYRATMAAASDLAAMGAAPLGLLAALVLPENVSDEDLRALAQGQQEAASLLNTQIIGGNLARGSELSITTTALGESTRPLTRSGAHPGEAVALAGPLGLSAAGLLLLEKNLGHEEDAKPALHAYRRPTARLREALAAAPIATAAIDISDGLARDLHHLAKASNVRVVLEPGALVTEALARAATLANVDPLPLALHGGEDYAILTTVPENDIPPGFVKIGLVRRAESGLPPITMTTPAGPIAVENRGYDHFG